MAAVGSLEEEALKRRSKLRNLKNKRDKDMVFEPDSKKTKEEESDSKRPALKFRSYKPKDESLQELQLPRTKPASSQFVVHPPTPTGQDIAYDTLFPVASEIEKNVDAAAVDDKEINLLSLAPKKPDWDLKRDVSRKLEKLERRTQRAIVDLIRQHLQKGEVSLAEAVFQTENQSKTASEDSD
eukprot:m.179969 g.179969  ORF g.179969 m.179969 type:complete len:183 (+) comp39237_c0_seq12:2482-3030(+)